MIDIKIGDEVRVIATNEQCQKLSMGQDVTHWMPLPTPPQD